MAKKSPVIIAFDLYGTILSTSSISTELAKRFGNDAAGVIAANWRRYQLEYTWRLNSMDIYRSFSDCTRAALRHAVAEQGLSARLSTADEDALMQAYDALHVFPDVKGALDKLKQGFKDGSIESYIFSNGTEKMVTSSLESSPELQPPWEVFRGVVTVEHPGVFKPSKRVYDHLLETAGKKDKAESVWLVTANPFDVVGARAVGMRAAWVDRAGTGWVDGLGEVLGGLRPTIIAGGVDELVKKILESDGP